MVSLPWIVWYVMGQEAFATPLSNSCLRMVERPAIFRERAFFMSSSWFLPQRKRAGHAFLLAARVGRATSRNVPWLARLFLTEPPWRFHTDCLFYRSPRAGLRFSSGYAVCGS